MSAACQRHDHPSQRQECTYERTQLLSGDHKVVVRVGVRMIITMTSTQLAPHGPLQRLLGIGIACHGYLQPANKLCRGVVYPTSEWNE